MVQIPTENPTKNRATRRNTGNHHGYLTIKTKCEAIHFQLCPTMNVTTCDNAVMRGTRGKLEDHKHLEKESLATCEETHVVTNLIDYPKATEIQKAPIASLTRPINTF